MVHDDLFLKWVMSNDVDRTEKEMHLLQPDYQKISELVKFKATLQLYFSIGGGDAYMMRRKKVQRENALILHADIKHNTRSNAIVLENLRKEYGF